MLQVCDVAPVLKLLWGRHVPRSDLMKTLLALADILAADLEDVGLDRELAETLAVRMLSPKVRA